MMDWQQAEGIWDDLKVHVKNRWNELTDDDLRHINGDVNKLRGTLQKRHGLNEAEAQHEIEEFSKNRN